MIFKRLIIKELKMKKIINRIKEQQKQNFEYTLFGSVPIIIQDKLTNNIDMRELIAAVETLLPFPPKDMIKNIYVGDYAIFNDRKVNALYHQNNLYISNDQDDMLDLLDDIIHEYSHALEQIYGDQIYSDKEIEDEFLLKRHKLESTLKHQGFDISKYDFYDVKYNGAFDMFLLNVVGYEKFDKLTNYGLFITPYAATSLREYFATGFEEYILGDHRDLQTISPSLIKKIKKLLN